MSYLRIISASYKHSSLLLFRKPSGAATGPIAIKHLLTMRRPCLRAASPRPVLYMTLLRKFESLVCYSYGHTHRPGSHERLTIHVPAHTKPRSETMIVLSRIFPLFAGALLITMSTGCATNSKLAEVRTEAREAQRTAEHALTVAQEANNRSMRTEEMLDRSFKRGMRK